MAEKQREKAAQCRRQAFGVVDDRLCSRILALAAAYDSAADDLEAQMRQSGGSSAD